MSRHGIKNGRPIAPTQVGEFMRGLDLRSRYEFCLTVAGLERDINGHMADAMTYGMSAMKVGGPTQGRSVGCSGREGKIGSSSVIRPFDLISS